MRKIFADKKKVRTFASQLRNKHSQSKENNNKVR